MAQRVPVLFDTDIGSFADDAFALALGCNANASAPTDFDTGVLCAPDLSARGATLTPRMLARPID